MDRLPPSCSDHARAHREPEVAGFFERRTCAIHYVVSDPDTGACAIIVGSSAIKPIAATSVMAATANHMSSPFLALAGLQARLPAYLGNTG